MEESNNSTNLHEPPADQAAPSDIQPMPTATPSATVTEAPARAVISAERKRTEKLKERFKLGVLVVSIFAIVLLILNFVITPTEVNGISMHPTFYTGNIVLVWKFPETWADITNSQYIPNRGNIVVVKQTPVSGEDLIKRVVGLPGETIVINNGTVTIYNPQHPAGFDPDKLYFHGYTPVTAGLVNTQIGPGRIFVMGDNRVPGASIDSRSSIGTVPSHGISGRVIMRVFPFNKITIF